MDERYVVESIKDKCLDFLKKQNSIDEDVEIVNFLENSLNILKNKISEKIDNNAKILKIEQAEYKKIIKCIEKEDANIIMPYFLNGHKVNAYNMNNSVSVDIHKNKENTEYEDNESITKWINIAFGEINSKNIPNKLRMEEVDLGFNNIYTTYCIDSIDDTNIHKIPFDTLIFDKSIEQIIIKLGNIHKYKIVNTRLCKVYSYKNNSDNFRSIICNNIRKKTNQSQEIICNLKNCKYYHDPFLGSKNNFHKIRQYSSNPVVFMNNTPMYDFKSGECVAKNTEQVPWVDAITLYQSSLANLLIACIHSKK